MKLLFFQILTLALSGIFSDQMIFQQGRTIPVWGSADAFENVTVCLYNESDGSRLAMVRTKAGKDGSWSLSLPALKAEGQSLRMTVKGKNETVEYSGIAVGEVWVCSGQSNMAYEMKRSWQAAPRKGDDLATLELQKAANPSIRVFYSGRGGGRWRIADGETLAPVSAAGYFFAKNISDSLSLPVGIISAASGGSSIEQWLPDGMLYKFQLKPYAPFAVAGFLWYQGETNCSQKDRNYFDKFSSLVQNWRADFNAPDAPFYTVMLCPHTFSDRLHRGSKVTAEELPLFWQQQIRAAREIENCEIVCLTDLVDNLEDIHPSYKWTVGQRLALVALAQKYKVDNAAEWSGPRAVAKKTEGDRIIVSFNHCAEGLKARPNSNEPRSNAQLKWFEVAGSDGIWHQAIADIISSTEIAVSHPDVSSPVSVRFAWRETAQPNLFNSAGLPAFPFCL